MRASPGLLRLSPLLPCPIPPPLRSRPGQHPNGLLSDGMNMDAFVAPLWLLLRFFVAPFQHALFTLAPLS